MNEEELKEIKERAYSGVMVLEDTRALIAEVERLRQMIRDSGILKSLHLSRET